MQITCKLNKEVLETKFKNSSYDKITKDRLQKYINLILDDEDLPKDIPSEDFKKIDKLIRLSYRQIKVSDKSTIKKSVRLNKFDNNSNDIKNEVTNKKTKKSKSGGLK